MSKDSLAIFIPCHNRQAITCSFVEHLYAQLPPECNATIHILDDGSTDGTGKAITQRWPTCIVHRLNGRAYWGGCLYYIQEYAKYSLPAKGDPLILIANDDIHFQAAALSNALGLMKAGTIDVLVPVLVDVPQASWGNPELKEEGLESLARRSELEINYGDHYDCDHNRYSRLTTPGSSNIGVTAALLIRRSRLIRSASVPRGMPHYGSDFWLTHSLACSGQHLSTHASYVVLRRKETTRPSSRAQGRRKYWQQCCNPSSPDYLPASIVFQRQFSRSPAKAWSLWVLTIKYMAMRMFTKKAIKSADLAISLPELIARKNVRT